MMKFKKFLAVAMTGAMMFGVVATAAPAVAVYASGDDGGEEAGGGNNASDSGIQDAKIDYEKMILTVTTDDSYFTVDVLKTESDKAKPSKSYTYAGGGSVKIDLGFLKIKKANILNIYGASQTDKTKGEIVKIAAQPTKEKFTVDTTKDTLAEALGKTDANKALYEYRSSFGSNWYPLDDLEFTSAKVAGTTIVVRLKAVNDESSKDAPAGPEAKVKIPASPKAPKVTVDYVKDSVKVTDKMQIALLLDDGPVAEATGWKDAKKGMTRSEIVAALGIASDKESEEFSIVVRTAANGKKSASMPVIVSIKATSELEAAAGENPASATFGTSTIKADKTDKGVTFTVTGNATFQYDKGGNKWTNITSGKEIKISGTVKVRVAPEKEDTRTAGSGAFASNSVTLTPAEKASADDEGDEE